MEEPSLEEIKKVLKFIKENFTVKSTTLFDEVYDTFINVNPKCYECSSTCRMFCQSSPDECHGPHQW